MKFLEDIEKLLKRKLPRATAPEPAPAGRHSQQRAREPHPERGARPQPRGASNPPAQPQQPAARPSSLPAFDFTKPYEPPSSSTTQDPPAVHPARSKPHRPTAALLGGSPAKREPHKS
jgi:hypothetical protein